MKIDVHLIGTLMWRLILNVNLKTGVRAGVNFKFGGCCEGSAAVDVGVS